MIDRPLNISYDHRIDINGVIKVADFGLAEDMFASGYFRQVKKGSTIKLPFRWMPLESLQEGLFSEKSDVVSGCTHAVFFALCLKSL